MARFLVSICVLFAIGCSDKEFVIGRYIQEVRDAGDPAGNENDAGAPNRDASIGNDEPRDSGSPGESDAGPVGSYVNECLDTYPDAIACSSFEDQRLNDEWSEVIFMGESALERSTARAHRGQRSLRAESSAPASRAAVVAKFPRLYEGELFLRAYVYVPSGLATNIMNIFFLGDDARHASLFEGVDLNIQDGALQAYLPQHDPARYTSELPIPRDAWFCLRAHLVLDDQDGALTVYADDAPVLELRGLDTVPNTGVREFRAGIDWSSEQEEFFEVFIDDVVLARREVVCLD